MYGAGSFLSERGRKGLYSVFIEMRDNKKEKNFLGFSSFPITIIMKTNYSSSVVRFVDGI